MTFSTAAPSRGLAAATDPLARAIAIAFAIAIAVLVASPWLAPGYLFGTDWPGPRRFDLPSAITSAAPLQVALAVISYVVGAEITGKILVLSILVVAGFLAFNAAPTTSLIARAAGATLFVFNPFVFGRLHYGQLFLLAGYAGLPWVAHRLRLVWTQPSVGGGVWLGVSAGLVAVFSPHIFLVVGVLAAATLTGHVLWMRSALPIMPAAVAALTTVVLSSYWLVPLLVGRGAEAAVIAGTGQGLLNAYAAVGDAHLGLVPNLLGLFGFWAENSGRFTSMKDFVAGWPLVLAVLLFVSAIGAVSAFRKREDRLGTWVAGLIAAGAIGLVLEMGVSNSLTAGLVHWLDSVFPIYRGMRDAGKWAALLALVYSQLLALGVEFVLEWLRRLRLPVAQAEWVTAVGTGVLIALPLYYGNGLLFGMHGEIQPSQYPAGWYSADRFLSSDPHPGRTLFLPWHLYMRFSFVRNQNSVIGPPGPTFFSVPIVVSSDPEVGVPPPDTPDQRVISSLVGSGARGEWGPVLASRGIKYVLVAREVDWKSYDFLKTQTGLLMDGDYGSIVLYRNSYVL